MRELELARRRLTKQVASVEEVKEALELAKAQGAATAVKFLETKLARVSAAAEQTQNLIDEFEGL